jgi:phosphoserine phosphatase
MKSIRIVISLIFLTFLMASCNYEGKEKVNKESSNPLPSWNDGPAKSAIIQFVNDVTNKKSSKYVKPIDRIATFDNDGTLWVEQPIYTQITFAFDRIKELAGQHPEWKTQQPFKGLLEGDMEAVGASGTKGIMEILVATHTGITNAEFEKIALEWLTTSKHSKFDRTYNTCIFQPQLELMTYLRTHDFKTFICSGGGIAFMRPISERAYGIPTEQVIGSSVVTEFQMKDGKPALMRMPKINFINDKKGKPVGINQHIGRRPIFAFGNSDADMQMIEYTMAGDGPRMGLFVHHTDDVNEYAYDRKSRVGTLDKALDMADAKGWHIVDMKKDWNRVFPFSK